MIVTFHLNHSSSVNAVLLYTLDHQERIHFYYNNSHVFLLMSNSSVLYIHVFNVVHVFNVACTCTRNF